MGRDLRKLGALRDSAVKLERVLAQKMDAAHPGDEKRAARHWMMLAEMMLESDEVQALPPNAMADEAEKRAVDGFAQGFKRRGHCLVCANFPDDILTMMLRWRHG